MPVAGPRPNFAGLIARESQALEAAEAVIGSHAGVMAHVGASELEAEGALDLGDVAAELDGQSREPDLAIGAVAGGAEALERELAGLTGQLPGDFADAPAAPNPARDGDYRTQPGGKRDGDETGRDRPDRPGRRGDDDDNESGTGGGAPGGAAPDAGGETPGIPGAPSTDAGNAPPPARNPGGPGDRR